MKKLFFSALIAASLTLTAQAAKYMVDIPGMHASINFKVNHLGYSWLLGRFDKFDGLFIVDDKNFKNSTVEITIDTNSVNSNHAERDKHLRSPDFLNTKKFPEAKFVSKKIEGDMNDFKIIGDFTFNGVTKELVIDAKHIGGGKDPWGGFRQGFEGTTSFKMADYNVKKSLGPKSEEVFLTLHVEGIKR
ncbi:MAG: YceI family protein [Pseudomonadota bacterium]